MFAAAALGSAAGFSFRKTCSSRCILEGSASISFYENPSALCWSKVAAVKRPASVARLAVACNCSIGSSDVNTESLERNEQVADEDSQSANSVGQQPRRSAVWEAARTYKDYGLIYDGKIAGFNSGGLLVRFYSLVGFLPYPRLSPHYSCKEPGKSIKEIARGLIGSVISVKVITASEETRKLIFSEKDVSWSKFSDQVNLGDIFEGKVGLVEDFGAFVHLRFPDGCYYLTGFVHISEVSWDLVQDVRDVLKEGDDIRVKVINVNRKKARITLSIRQLQDDPLYETLDKVIPQVKSDTSNVSENLASELLPGLESICEELQQEDGITDVSIGRKGFEKRVVSQDLELWLSNAPIKDKQFTILARAGREVQEIQLTTDLDQEAIKQAVQRILGRIP